MAKRDTQIVVRTSEELKSQSTAKAEQLEQPLSSLIRQFLKKLVEEGPWFLYVKQRGE